MERSLLYLTFALLFYRGSIQHSLCEVDMASESTYIIRLIGAVCITGIIGTTIILYVF